jgi:hypothetical protein
MSIARHAHEPTPTSDPRPSADERLRPEDRLAALAGTVFVVAILVGNVFTESVVGTDPTPAGTAGDLLAQSGAGLVRAGFAMELLGLLCLAIFAAGVTAHGCRRAPVGISTLLVGVGASLVVSVKLSSAAPYLAALHGAETLPDQVLHALVETNGVAFVLTWLPFALFVAGVAGVLGRAGLIGRPLAGVGLALAGLGLVVGLVGAVEPQYAVPVPFLLSVLWTGVVGLRVATTRLRQTNG